MQKNQIADLGTNFDLCHSKHGKHQDNHAQRGRIEMVRKWLYERGMLITGVYFKRVLERLSETPTWVCIQYT